jgi:hypothetical protein
VGEWQRDALLLGVFGVLALTSVRNIPLLAVVAAPILCRQLVGLTPTFRAVRQVPRRPGGDGSEGGEAGAHFGQMPRLSLAARVRRDIAGLWQAEADWTGVPLTVMAAALVVAGVAPRQRDVKALEPAVWTRSSGWDLPYAAMNDLRDTADQGLLLNDYGWGGYLIWALDPPQRVFIDGRADVYGDAILRDYADMVQLAPNWQQLIDRYAIRRVLLPPTTPLVQALRLLPAWRVVHEDDTSVLLVHSGP